MKNPKNSFVRISGLREKANPNAFYVCRGNFDYDYLTMFHHEHNALDYASYDSCREVITYDQMLELYYNSNPRHGVCLENFYI